MTNLFKPLFIADWSFAFFFAAFLFSWAKALAGEERRGKEGLYPEFISGILGSFSLILLEAWRWKESGHLPLSNLYESLLFLSICFSILGLVGEKYFRESLIGPLSFTMGLLILAFANFGLGPEMKELSPLVPALQSNWLMMHVSLMISSYALLSVGSLLSVAFLVAFYSQKTREVPFVPTSWNAPNGFESSSETLQSENKEPNFLQKPFEESKAQREKEDSLFEALDGWSYRLLGFAFPLLTTGIFSGAVWANEAWGSYWSWDPKETWALLTWLLFAIYLHARFTKGLSGQIPAMIASLGFLGVWMCFLGVNLLGEGLHSYGWFSS